MASTTCPVCDEDIILPYGPKTSPILFIRSSPNEKEAHTRPFSDRAGDILKREMYAAGISLNECRQIVLWNHKLQEAGCNEFCEFQLFPELKDKKLVILVGAEAVSYFTIGLYGVDEVKGLDISDEITVDVTEYADFDLHWTAMESPAIAFVKGVGELRFAIDFIKKFMDEHITK